MNNLKRVLSLALASVMLIGMMAVSASATSFTDDKDIENKEAVGTMVALNIIDGMGDGTFDPKGELTRAQAAKMVFVALNGGQKNDNLTTKEVGTFSDVKKGHWAEGYIEWCYNRGIIAGMGNGTFVPDGKLTGTQLAKIMLVAIGYNAKTEGLEGTNDWALNVNALALNKGFYKNLAGIDPEAVISREDAAQLILDACNAEMVKYEYQITANNGQIATVARAVDVKDASAAILTQTILTKCYNAGSFTGQLTAYDLTNKVYTYTVGLTNVTSDQDFTAFIGERVKVLYQDENNSGGFTAGESVYGLASESVVETSTVGDIALTAASGSTPAYVTVNGNKYNFQSDAAATAVPVYESDKNRTAGLDVNLSVLGTSYSEASIVKLVDLDANGKMDQVIVTPVVVAKVTYVTGTTSITTTPGVTTLTGAVTAAATTFKLADNTIYTGAAKGDYVTIIPAAYSVDGKAVIAKAETVTGTVTRVRGDDSAAYDLEIDGNWYSEATVGSRGGDDPKAGDDVTLIVVGDYYYAAKVTTTTVTDLLVVNDATVTLGTVTAAVTFIDGTSTNVTVAQVDTDTTGSTMQSTLAGAKGKLYTYTVSTSGAYTLKSLADPANMAGYKLYTTTGTGTPDTKATDVKTDEDYLYTADGKYRFADDAVVFYFDSSKSTTKVYTGKAVKAWSVNLGTAGGDVLGTTVNGFKTANVVVLKDATTSITSAGDLSYGYVVSKSATLAKEGTKYYVNFQIWNGKEVLDAKEEATQTTDTTAAQWKAKAFVVYEDMGGGLVKNTTAMTWFSEPAATTNCGFNEYAVTALQGKDIALTYTLESDTTLAAKASEVVYKLTDDTIIIGINSTDRAGVENPTIQIATESATSGLYKKNVWALIDKSSAGASGAYDAGDKVIVIFVDSAK